jgi:hypothetical protein
LHLTSAIQRVNTSSHQRNKAQHIHIVYTLTEDAFVLYVCEHSHLYTLTEETHLSGNANS